MRCLIRYQLRAEATMGRYQFCSDAPDLDQVILQLSRFLHPEVVYEFPPMQGNHHDSIAQLRLRMTHARQFLQQYCGISSLSYMILPEDADTTTGQWTTLLASDDESIPAV